MDGLIDLRRAVTVGAAVARRGPVLGYAEAAAVVRELEQLAAEAAAHVEAYTGLVPAAGVTTSVVVADRATWVEHNVTGLGELAAPLLDKLAAARTGRSGRPAPAVLTAAGRTLTGAELGAVLGWLSSKVLGQYEPFLPAGGPDGRLTLVGPNIVAAERQLGVPTRDFRLWVCLHEQTHRSQFTAVPWLAGYLRGLVAELAAVTDTDPAALLGRLRAGLRGALPGAARTGDGTADRPVPGVLGLLATPEQRAVVDRVQAVMTLLEGHADQVMDAVGPAVVPSVALIRERFDARRRQGGSPWDRLLRSLLGLDAKLAQYRTGGAFARAVVDRVGVAGFRAVFDSPACLPTPAELADPARWLQRVAGVAA